MITYSKANIYINQPNMKTLIFSLYIIALCQVISASPNSLDEKFILDFGKKIESALQNNNPGFINNRVNYDKLFGAFLVQDAKYSSFNSDFKRNVQFNLGLGTIMYEENCIGAEIEFINWFEKDKELHFLYRIFSEQGLNYYELTCLYHNGLLSINDAKSHLTSAVYSDRLKGLYSTLLPKSRKSAYSKTENPKDNYTEINAAMTLDQLIKKGKYYKAFNSWKSLPVKLKSSKVVLAKAIEAASYTSITETEKLINLYRSNFPGDGGIFLLPLEGYYNNSNHIKALGTLDSLALYVKDDPYLFLYRGFIYDEMGELESAELAFKKLITMRPSLSASYFSLLELYVLNNRYPDAITLLDNISNTFGFYKQELYAYLNMYQSFIKSDEFSLWNTSD